jgi:hypothetical protein
MPLSQILVLTVAFTLFFGFMLILGLTSIWVALGDRLEVRKSVTKADRVKASASLATFPAQAGPAAF